MKEKEISGNLSVNEFQAKLRVFTKKFGEPKLQRRLSLEINSLDFKTLDTRIKITNGVPKLVQKIGDWTTEGGLEREEIELSIRKNAEYIYKFYTLLSNMYSELKEVSSVISQFENYLFKSADYEIKLTHQFGKAEIYHFELEALNDKVDLIKESENLNLIPELTIRDKHFWKEWNQKINLNSKEMSKQKLILLINSYLS